MFLSRLHFRLITSPRRPDLTAASVVLLALLVVSPRTGNAQGSASSGDQEASLPTIGAFTEGMTHVDGFMDVYLDMKGGKVHLEVAREGEDFLYVVSLPAGLGSNDIGLDRNQLGGERVVRFERFGPKALLRVPNLDYRAETDNEAERRSVADAFAGGVLEGFKVVAESEGRFLVDATDFFLRDAHGVVDRLRRSGQGTFRVDPSRSAPYADMIKGFPKNTEVEMLLTFTSDAPGGLVRSVASEPGSFSVRQRHSFIELPPPGYTPRLADPRAGFFGPSFADFASDIGSDMRVRYIARHRLEKKNPEAERSEAVEPIVYWLDAGTPEPVRSALLDGARWWNDAFEAAGFINAFQVRVLPDDADPMDVRYNMINWVHRSTRGWSYGSSVTDPRTGEIIKGHVLLGSLRVRQDYLIAEGLLAPYGENSPPPGTDPMLDMALARIRQLSAHEVGHTIGIQHNFAASPNGRASVMDYPAPLATLTADGQVDLSQAYDTGIGEWDTFVVRYGYTQFPDSIQGHAAREAEALSAILKEMRTAGYDFITDADARPTGSAHPDAHLWDNLADPVNALETQMAVREAALSRFGAANIRDGRPVALLEETLVLLYLGHRYQVEAVSKLLGGVHYTYAVKGDGQPLPSPVAAQRQQAALGALLDVLSPGQLALPPHLRTGIPPRPPGFGRHRELFGRDTGLTFDPYTPAASVSRLVFSLLLDPARTARLAYQDDFDTSLPSLLDVLETVTEAVWGAPVPNGAYEAELQRLVQRDWTEHLLRAAGSGASRSASGSPAARSLILYHLRTLHGALQENMNEGSPETQAHRMDLFDLVDRYLFRPWQPTELPTPDVVIPPGSPIGQE